MGLTVADLRARFGDEVGDAAGYLPGADGRAAAEVPLAAVHPVLAWLRDEATPRFRQVASLTATDESLPQDSEPGRTALRRGAGARYRLVYHLRALGAAGQVLRLVAWVGEGETVPSVTDLYPGASWYEREVYDMFGIRFSGHPDLKRILMPDGYEGHPLQKDFPLRGLSPDRLYREWDLARGAEDGR